MLFVSDLTGWSCSQHCTDPSWDLHKAEDKGEIILLAFRKRLAEKKQIQNLTMGVRSRLSGLFKLPEQAVR